MIYVTGDIHGGCTMNNIVEWEEGKNLTHETTLLLRETLAFLGNSASRKTI